MLLGSAWFSSGIYTDHHSLKVALSLAKHHPGRESAQKASICSCIPLFPDAVAHLHNQNHGPRRPLMPKNSRMDGIQKRVSRQIQSRGSVKEQMHLPPMIGDLTAAEEEVFSVLKLCVTSGA